MSFLFSDAAPPFVPKAVLTLPVAVEGANAHSGALIYGFPALSAFVGFAHALHRKIVEANQDDESSCLADVAIDGIAVCCQAFAIHRHRDELYADYTLVQKRIPLLRSGETAPIVQEATCDFSGVLLLGVYSKSAEDGAYSWDKDKSQKQLARQVATLVPQLRIAGGCIVKLGQVQVWDKADLCKGETPSAQHLALKSTLYGGYMLMNAQAQFNKIYEDLLAQNPSTTRLDALLATARVDYVPQAADEGADKNANKNTDAQDDASNTQKAKAQADQAGRSNVVWQIQTLVDRYQSADYRNLVPLLKGFAPIAPKVAAGELLDARHMDYAGQFVEAIYGVGQWQSVFLADLTQAFWFADYRVDNAADDADDDADDAVPNCLYLITQKSL